MWRNGVHPDYRMVTPRNATAEDRQMIRDAILTELRTAPATQRVNYYALMGAVRAAARKAKVTIGDWTLVHGLFRELRDTGLLIEHERTACNYYTLPENRCAVESLKG